jgi:hypothetical protein
LVSPLPPKFRVVAARQQALQTHPGPDFRSRLTRPGFGACCIQFARCNCEVLGDTRYGNHCHSELRKLQKHNILQQHHYVSQCQCYHSTLRGCRDCEGTCWLEAKVHNACSCIYTHSRQPHERICLLGCTECRETRYSQQNTYQVISDVWSLWAIQSSHKLVVAVACRI